MSKYFLQTSCNEWDLPSAMRHYAGDNPTASIAEGMKAIEEELITITRLSKKPKKTELAKELLKELYGEPKDLSTANMYINNDIKNSSIGSSTINIAAGDKRCKEQAKPHFASTRKKSKQADETGEEKGGDDKCVILHGPPPVLATTNGIDIGPQPEDMSELVQRFHALKEAVVKRGSHELLTYESDVHDILALTHILLLKQNHVHLQRAIIGEDCLNEAYNGVQDEYLHCGAVSSTFTLELHNLMKPMTRASPEKNRSTVLKSISNKLSSFERNSFEYRVLRCLQNITEEFPIEPLIDIGEHDLIHGVIDPILRPLLSSSSCRLRWPEENANVRKCRTERTQRPDAVLSVIDGLQYTLCRGYGEAKAGNATTSAKATDLVRLAIFAKDCIDVNRLNHVVVFQIVGKKVTFYLMKLAAEGVYLFTVLRQIDFPQAISDLRSFIGNLDDLHDVCDAVHKTRATLDAGFWGKAHRETVDTPVFTHYIDKSRSKGRRCFIHYGP